jgi:hypothetical protein
MGAGAQQAEIVDPGSEAAYPFREGPGSVIITEWMPNPPNTRRRTASQWFAPGSPPWCCSS